MASATKRWSVILLALAATLVAVARVSDNAPVVKDARVPARPVAATAYSSTSASAAKPTDSEELRVVPLVSRVMSSDMDDMFAAPPKPAVIEKQAIAVPDAPPQAPPLPLRLLGKMTENGEPVLFLTWNELHLVAHVGDVIEETYRLEKIAGGQAEFVYLPLKIKQSLPVGEDS